MEHSIALTVQFRDWVGEQLSNDTITRAIGVLTEAAGPVDRVHQNVYSTYVEVTMSHLDAVQRALSINWAGASPRVGARLVITRPCSDLRAVAIKLLTADSVGFTDAHTAAVINLLLQQAGNILSSTLAPDARTLFLMFETKHSASVALTLDVSAHQPPGFPPVAVVAEKADPRSLPASR